MPLLTHILHRLSRWRYVIATYRDYASRLNWCVEVENELLSVAAGRRGLLTPAECRQLAIKLGTPVTK